MKNNEIDRDIDNTIILELIRTIQLAYYYEKEEESLIPAWEIKVDDMVYYFDLYEGNMIYSHKI